MGKQEHFGAAGAPKGWDTIGGHSALSVLYGGVSIGTFEKESSSLRFNARKGFSNEVVGILVFGLGLFMFF